jgi:hypothetical protein
MLTSIPAVDVLLAENGSLGYVTVANRLGLVAGAIVELHSTLPLDNLNLKVQSLDGLKVYLWDPSTQTPFDASAYLVSDGAHLVQASQNLFGGSIRQFFIDPKDDETPLAQAELATILQNILPGGATLASNVTVTNFPAQQHVVVDNQVSVTTQSTAANGDPVPAKGTEIAGRDSGGLARYINVGVDGSIIIDTTVFTDGSQHAIIDNFPATQPISAVSLPLPTGAATSANQINGSQITQLANWTVLDTGNSSSTPLAGDAIFTGVGITTIDYTSIHVSIFTDQPGTIQLQGSSDNINWDHSLTDAVEAGSNSFSSQPDYNYFRIVYTNGSTPQGVFRMSAILSKDGNSGDCSAIGSPVVLGQKSQLVKSVITGKQPMSEGNGYKEVMVDARGSLLVSEATSHATFGSFLTSNEVAATVFKAIYGINTRTCSIISANGGTVTWDSARANLQTSAASNGSIKLSTREAVRYVPGQGNIARGAPVFSAPATSSRQAWGFLSDTDGFAFGYNGTQFGILIRSNSIDTWIPQNVWNGDDKFDGFGITGNLLIPTFGSPMQIQMQWLGYGAVRFFVEDPNTGDFVLVHIHKFANTSAVPSIQQPSLPVRFELVNVGNTSNLSAFIASMGGFAEGDRDIPGADVRFSFSNSVVGVPTTGARVFTIRNKPTNVFGGTNTNAVNVHIDHMGIRASSTGDMFIQLILNPTLTGASFSDINAATSVMQSDVSSTFTASTGVVLMTIPVTSNTSTTEVIDSYNIRLAPGDVLGVIAFSEGGTINTRASLSWHEEN